MEYTNVISLVPQGEHFDSTALNEGIWLSAAHLNGIESALATGQTNVSALQTERDGLNTQLTAANTAQQNAEASLATANTTIQTLTDRINVLEAGPAKTFTNTTKLKTDTVVGGEVKELSETTVRMNKMRVDAGLNPIQ